MNRCMNLNSIGMPLFKTIHRSLPSMRGAVIGYPEDPICRFIRFLVHYKINQFLKTCNSGTASAQSKDFCSVNIPGCHVCQRPFSFIFMLNPAKTSRTWSRYRGQAAPGLNAGLFIRRNYKILLGKGLALPYPMIQIKDSGCFFLKVRISGPDPATVAPGPDSIFIQPSPDRFSAYGSNNSLSYGISSDLGVRKPGKRKPQFFWQLTSQRLNSYNSFRGKKRRASPGVAFPEAQPGVAQRIVCATWKRSAGANRGARRYPYLKDLQLRGGQFWRA